MRAAILGLFILTCVSIANGKKLKEVNLLTANVEGAETGGCCVSLTIYSASGDHCFIDSVDNLDNDDFEKGQFDRFAGKVLKDCEGYEGYDFSDVVGLYVKNTILDDWTFEFIRVVFDDMTYADCGEGRTTIGFGEGILIPCQ